MLVLIDAEKNVFDCEEELRHGRDGDGSSLYVRRLFGTDNDTKSSGEGL